MKSLFLSGILFVIIIVSTAIMKDNMLIMLMLVGCLGLQLHLSQAWNVLPALILFGLIAAAAESRYIQRKNQQANPDDHPLWNYYSPDVAGIPMWLPLFWMYVALIMFLIMQ